LPGWPWLIIVEQKQPRSSRTQKVGQRLVDANREQAEPLRRAIRAYSENETPETTNPPRKAGRCPGKPVGIVFPAVFSILRTSRMAFTASAVSSKRSWVAPSLGPSPVTGRDDGFAVLAAIERRSCVVCRAQTDTVALEAALGWPHMHVRRRLCPAERCERNLHVCEFTVDGAWTARFRYQSISFRPMANSLFA
jgi:hypothetical protein